MAGFVLGPSGGLGSSSGTSPTCWPTLPVPLMCPCISAVESQQPLGLASPDRQFTIEQDRTYRSSLTSERPIRLFALSVSLFSASHLRLHSLPIHYVTPNFTWNPTVRATGSPPSTTLFSHSSGLVPASGITSSPGRSIPIQSPPTHHKTPHST